MGPDDINFMLFKVIGILFILLGFFIIKNFPGYTHHQKEGMTLFGIFIGVLVFVLGIALFLFG